MTRVATFIIMFAFWVTLSGMFDPFHLGMGVVCCLFLSIISTRLIFPVEAFPVRVSQFGGMLIYLMWLLKEILLASLQVSYLAISPKMRDEINPQLVRFRTRLKTPFARVTFAQSITLTPGTITVSVIDDEFTVYALTDAAARSLPGAMERRIAQALGDGQ